MAIRVWLIPKIFDFSLSLSFSIYIYMDSSLSLWILSLWTRERSKYGINFWNYNRIQCTQKQIIIIRDNTYSETQYSNMYFEIIGYNPAPSWWTVNSQSMYRFRPVGFRITKKNILEAMVEWRMPHTDKYPSVCSPL